jgi:hypothetical protein
VEVVLQSDKTARAVLKTSNQGAIEGIHQEEEQAQPNEGEQHTTEKPLHPDALLDALARALGSTQRAREGDVGLGECHALSSG